MANVVRLWGAVEYNADLRFFDHMYKVAKEVGKNFQHWWTNRISVIVHDYERKELISFSSKRIGFEALNPDDINKSFNNLANIVKGSLSEFDCRKITRMGLKLNIYEDTGLSFDEIRQQLRPICIPNNERLEKLTSTEILDLQLRFDYKWQDKTAMLRIAPMNKEQGLLDIQNVGDITRLFPPIERGDDYPKFLTSIPESFLGFDLDVFTKGDHAPNEWPTFTNDVAPYLVSVFEGLKNIVLERESGKA
jgi:hypothetical protein